MGFEIDNSSSAGPTGAMFPDNLFEIYDVFDPTIKIKFNVSGNTGTTSTFVVTQLVNESINFVDGKLAIDSGGTNNDVAYTAGSVIFSDGTKLTQDNANFFWDDTNDRLGIGTSSPNQEIEVSKSKAGSNVAVRVINTSAAANSDALIIMQTTAGAGNPHLIWAVDGLQNYAFGIDNADSDSLKLSTSSAVATNTALRLSSAGVFNLPNLTASLPVQTDASKNLVSAIIGISGGGTNNGSLGVTAGGQLYTDGSKLMNTGAGNAGDILVSQGASAPSFVQFTGVVVMYGAATAPTGWLLCDGSAVSRTTYARLFAIISTTFGTGDGSTTFNLPDFRGIFPAGAGSQTISSITYTRTLGTKQGDTMQGHYHSYEVYSQPGSTSSTDNYIQNNTSPGLGPYSGSPGRAAIKSPVTDSTNGTPRTGSETRPANLGITFIIKT